MAKFNAYTLRYKDETPKALKLLGYGVKAALKEIGEYVAQEANNRAPVGDTGRLHQSYKYTTGNESTGEKTVAIYSELPYAPYVEFGTGPHYTKPPQWAVNYAPRGHHDQDPWWYMGEDGDWHLGWFVRARPHLIPAVNENISNIRDIVKKNLKNV